MRVNIARNFHNLFFVIIVIAYFELFRFAFIPPVFRMLIGPAVGALLVVVVLIKAMYGHQGVIKMNFSFPILLLLIGSLPSYLTARAFHDQPLLSSIMASSRIWFYLLYFYMHFYRISIRFIFRTVVFVGLLAVVLYYVQFILYPEKLLEIPMLKQRGTIRLLVPGMLCSQAAYFYFLNRFFTRHRPIFLILAFLIFSIFVLQGTRQLLFGMAFLTIVYVIVSSRVKSKLGIMVLILLALGTFFFAFREIINEMLRVSTTTDSSGLIRIKAARFFLTKFMANDWAYIFGNGDAGPGSSYYYELFTYTLKYGFYLSDIGIIGDYVSYGIVFVLGGFLLLGKGLVFRVSPEHSFLKFYILTQCFTLLTSKGLFSGVDIIILMILYIFDVNRFELKKERILTSEEDEGSPILNAQIGKV